MKNYLKKIISVILISVLVLSYPAGLFAEVIDLREEGSANGWSYAAAILGGFYSGYTGSNSYGPQESLVRTYLIPKLSDKLVWKMGVHDEMWHGIASSALSTFANGVYSGEGGSSVQNNGWGSVIVSTVSSGAKTWLTKTVYNKYEDEDKGFAQFASFVSGLAFDLVSGGISSIITSYYDANKNTTANQAANENEAADGNGVSVDPSLSSGDLVPDPNKVGDGAQFTIERKGIRYRQVEKQNKDGSTTIVLEPVEQLTKGKDGKYRYQPVDKKNSVGRFLWTFLTGRDRIPSKIHIRLKTEDKAVGPTPSTEGATPSTEGATPSTEGATLGHDHEAVPETTGHEGHEPDAAGLKELVPKAAGHEGHEPDAAGLKELVPKAAGHEGHAGDASGKQEPARGPWGPWWVLKWFADKYEGTQKSFSNWGLIHFGRIGSTYEKGGIVYQIRLDENKKRTSVPGIMVGNKFYAEGEEYTDQGRAFKVVKTPKGIGREPVTDSRGKNYNNEDGIHQPPPVPFYIPDNRTIEPIPAPYPPMYEVKQQPDTNPPQVASMPVDWNDRIFNDAWNSVSN